MKQTYDNLLSISALYEGDETNSELAIHYQETGDPVYLAVVYCRYFGYIQSSSKTFFGITEEDKGSFALEELNNAMLDYNAEVGAEVQTLFGKYFYNRLRSETQATNLQKRKANNNCQSWEETAELFSGYEQNETKIAEVELTMNQAGVFSENEINYCKMVMKTDNIKDSDIAHLLNLSPSAVFQMKKRIQKKMAGAMQKDLFGICLT